MAKRNKFPYSQYEHVKNDTYTLVVFEGERRVFSYSGLNLAQLVHEMVNCQGLTRSSLVVNDKVLEKRKHDRLCLDRDINSYEDLFRLNEYNMDVLVGEL